MNTAASIFTRALILGAGGILASGQVAFAAQPAATGNTTPILATADYNVIYTCTAGPGCTLGDGYAHSYHMNFDIHGAISGTGTQTGYPQITEKLTGALTRNGAHQPESLSYLSTYDGLFAGYTVTESGSVDLVSGALNGSATATMPGLPSWAATFSVTGVRTSLTVIQGWGNGGSTNCDRPGNLCNTPAAQNSQAWKWQPLLSGATTTTITNPHANGGNGIGHGTGGGRSHKSQ